VTGVAVLDTHVVKLLMQAIRATKLLGAQVLLAGITAPMAQVVVAQGLDLGALRTFRDLRSAIEAALPNGAGSLTLA
jgi:rsbT co-antagonist protein RsbR